jgi:ribosomal-protein-alanine N-acetyltransferase
MVIVETNRLLLRHFHIVDGDAMDRVFGDPEVMQYGKGVKSPERVRQWLRGCLQDYHELWGFGLWAIVEKDKRQVIGFCGFSLVPDVGGQPETEIGYRLARAYWGRGLATEAATAVRNFGFQTLCLPRLIAIIDPKNIASVRVAEKMGLRYEKDAIFQEMPVCIFALNRPAGG